MTWDNFRRPIKFGTKVYGTKEMEFSGVESLPGRVRARFEVAVGGASPPAEHWRSLGWSVIDSHGVSATVDDYCGYIERSRGEFSVAKNVYVATRCGWSSCRSVCYLAAGRPVVVQDTGFSDIIPSKEGVIAFKSLEEAVDAITAVEADYSRHQQCARHIAENYFASDVVLRQLLQRTGIR
jgi:hypothetical protein